VTLSVAISQRQRALGTWSGNAILELDHWLRRRQGVYEYTSDRNCIFRIQRLRARSELMFADGTHIRQGDPLLQLHLWNEQLPVIGSEGPSVAWGRRIGHGIRLSLDELARHIRSEPALREIVAVYCEMRLGAREQGEQLARMAARYGFESPTMEHTGTNPLKRFAENIMGLLLVLATNPMAARFSVLRRDRVFVYLSRAALERYGHDRSELAPH
jgi:hypothetical protein